MDNTQVIEVAFKALTMAFVLSGPVLIALLIVGLIIGVLQAATSINEATLSFIPKLLALGITLSVVGSWQVTTLVDYTRALFQRIPSLLT